MTLLFTNSRSTSFCLDPCCAVRKDPKCGCLLRNSLLSFVDCRRLMATAGEGEGASFQHETYDRCCPGSPCLLCRCANSYPRARDRVLYPVCFDFSRQRCPLVSLRLYISSVHFRLRKDPLLMKRPFPFSNSSNSPSSHETVQLSPNLNVVRTKMSSPAPNNNDAPLGGPSRPSGQDNARGESSFLVRTAWF
jgi:hypothetical protein